MKMKKINLEKTAAYTNSFIVAIIFLLIMIMTLSFLVKNLPIGQGIFLSTILLIILIYNWKKIISLTKKDVKEFAKKFHNFWSN